MMRIVQDIDVVNNISKADFDKNYLYPQKPVVIKGLLENEIAGKRWTMDYFKKTMGNVLVDVYDDGKKRNSAYTTPDIKMRLGDFLGLIDEDEHTDLRMFLFNLFKYNKELKKEFPCPAIFKGILDGFGYTFFGAKDSTVRIHYDIDMSNVLNTQVHGRKRVVLISPEYNELLYRLPLNTYSMVDLDNPDFDKYPALRFIKASECILEPGDSVFMPSGYWHLMTYLNGGMSVAYRKMAQTNKIKFQGFQNMCIYLPIDKLMCAAAGNSWQKFKEITAIKRADKAMSLITESILN